MNGWSSVKKMKTHNIGCVIFDIDGTLVDSMGVWADADRQFLEKRSIAYLPSLSDKLRFLSFEKASEFIRDKYSLPMTVEEVSREITENVMYSYAHEIKPFKGVRECLERLREKGIRLCAATANSPELAQTVLSANSLTEYLEFILTCEETGFGKDSRGFFAAVLDKLGLDADRVCLADDSSHSLKTAHEMGIFTIGIAGKNNSEYRNVCLYSDAVAESAADVYKVIFSLKYKEAVNE